MRGVKEGEVEGRMEEDGVTAGGIAVGGVTVMKGDMDRGGR